MTQVFEHISAQELQDMFAAYQARLEKDAARMIVKAQGTGDAKLQERVQDLLRLRDRLRARKEFSNTQVEGVIAKSLQGDGAAFETAMNDMHASAEARERKLSKAYGAASLTERQQKWAARAAAARKDSAVIENVFQGQDRIYLRLPQTPSDVAPKVAALLAAMPARYRITDWAKGKATDDKGKQEFNIGKLIKDVDVDLYKAFQDDATRTACSTHVVISRNEMDIAMASTNRAWHSCMGGGERGSFDFGRMAENIRKGALIAYLVSDTDPHINDPIARIFIKPFDTPRPPRAWPSLRQKIFNFITMKKEEPPAPFVPDTAYIADKSYGIQNPDFDRLVQDFLEQHVNAGIEGKFRLRDGCYDDGLRGLIRASGQTQKLDHWPK